MLPALDALIAVLRPLLLGLAVVLTGVAAVDWLIRTRRINPFGRIARFFRLSVEPLILPIEKRVVRAGGHPTHAPWWTLVVLAIAGIILLAGLTFVRDQVTLVSGSIDAGPRGVYRLLVTWACTLAQLAIMVRVVSSWVHFRLGAWYVRWAFLLSEPILRPIRNLVPLMGMVDISPIIGWFALGILETLLVTVW